MNSIKISDSIIKEVHSTGLSVSSVLEKNFAKELSEKREANPSLKSVSATKIALLDSGIDGSSLIEKLFTTDNNDLLFPAYITDLVDQTVKSSDIMKYLVSDETGIDSMVIKAPTLDLLSEENKKNLKRARVAEGAEIPVRKVNIGTKTVELYKKAIAMSQTYEALKYSRIDVASKMFKAVSGDIVGQNIDEIVATLESCNVKTLGTTATANTVTANELFEACMDYALKYGYAPTTAVASEEMFKSIANIMYNTQNEFGANSKLAIEVPQLNNMKIALVKANVSQKSGKNRVLLYNKDMSIQRFVANGSNIAEVQRNISNQTQLSTLSEISGYGSLIESVSEIVSA